MTLQEARQVLRQSKSSHSRQVEAAFVIAASKQSELSDLIRCLRLGGLPAETAAAALYTRTGRPKGAKTSELSTDADEWSRYLTRQLEMA